MNIKYLGKSSDAKVGATTPQAEDDGMEVLVVGTTFRPGPKANARIEKLFGADHYRAPGFCDDADACLDALDALGVTVFVKPTVDALWVVIFDLNDDIAVTKPFKKESHALAAALLLVLENKS